MATRLNIKETLKKHGIEKLVIDPEMDISKSGIGDEKKDIVIDNKVPACCSECDLIKPEENCIHGYPSLSEAVYRLQFMGLEIGIDVLKDIENQGTSVNIKNLGL